MTLGRESLTIVTRMADNAANSRSMPPSIATRDTLVLPCECFRQERAAMTPSKKRKLLAD
jgi:hypothetical protein